MRFELIETLFHFLTFIIGDFTMKNLANQENIKRSVNQIVKIGDILQAGGQENKVVEISNLGNDDSLVVKIDNGQEVSMLQLSIMVDAGQIIIKK
jgi:hypothetical protein